MTQARERWAGEHLRYDIPHLRLRQVADLIRATPARRVLDIGCATGHLRHLLPGIEYVGCDFAAPAQQPDFEFHLCDLNQGGLPSGVTGFDAIVCSGILEYVVALPAVLRDIAHQLRPAGTFVCTYFNDEHVVRSLSRLLLLAPYRHPDWTPLLSLGELVEQLTLAGLPVRATYASTLAIGPAPAVSATVRWRGRLRRVNRWTRPLAHQFVIACGRAR